MKFTLSWLKDHLDTNANLTTICDTLTAIGLEVESVTDRATALAPFTIAQIATADKHPDADRLKLCQVETGGATLQVVCGAPNARAGIKVVLAQPGAVIPATGEPLKKGMIRGVESQGMMCSARELGLGDDHEGIIELPADAPVGAAYASWAQLDDPVIEIKLTPNRPDCGGVRGLARDLAAAGIGTLKPMAMKPVVGSFTAPVTVTLDFPVDAAQACPHFVGRLIKGVKNGPSPDWLQRKLRAIGLRPISALVDITNYLTYDLMRPLHVFDASKLSGGLTVRYARAGESMAALDDKTYALPANTIVIADQSGPQAIGGVIGGAQSGCSDATTDVFLEAAYFDPAHIARTGRMLQLMSDARWRFERGIDPAFTQDGAERATQLIIELCGTPQTQISHLVIAGQAPVAARRYTLRATRCAGLIGVDVPRATQEQILTTLGCAVTPTTEGWNVTAPSWRPDILGEADLVEEVIRIHGFDKIPATPLTNPATMAPNALTPIQRRTNIARRALAANGLNEALTYSFMDSKLAALFQPANEDLRLLNPIAAELDMMRPSVIGNLLLAAKRNTDRGYPDNMLFEVGPIFRGTAANDQLTVASALRTGQTPRHWAQPVRAFDAFDAKADAMAVLTACGFNGAQAQITTDAPGYYHPGQSGTLRLGPTVLGYFGRLHPTLTQAFDHEAPAMACEVFLSAIPFAKNASTARPLLQRAALQPLWRDFAFVVNQDVTADKLMKCIRAVDKTLIADATLFDVYQGQHVASGKKSVALSVMLQPQDQSLTDAAIEAIAQKIVAAVAKGTGGTLRT